MEGKKSVKVPEVEFQIVAVRSFKSKENKEFHIVDVSVDGVGNATLFLPDGVSVVSGIRLGIYKNKVGFEAY